MCGRYFLGCFAKLFGIVAKYECFLYAIIFFSLSFLGRSLCILWWIFSISYVFLCVCMMRAKHMRANFCKCQMIRIELLPLGAVMCCQLLHTIELVPNSCSVQCNNNKYFICLLFTSRIFYSSALLIAPYRMYFIPSSILHQNLLEKQYQPTHFIGLLLLPKI